MQCPRQARFEVFIALALLTTGCSSQFRLTQPSLSTLVQANNRGERPYRVITHIHTSYSYDACDQINNPAGTPINPTCNQSLRKAFCQNHIDAMFLSDHPKNMESYSFETLSLYTPGQDTLLTQGTTLLANQAGGCSDGFTSLLMPGFENNLMALGLVQHLATDANSRDALYTAETAELAAKIRTDGQGLVAIPHTESRSVTTLTTINPDLIEIYNVHANLDPRMRKQYLGFAPFESYGAILDFLGDSLFHRLNANYLFLFFLKISDAYFQKWAQMVAAGLNPGVIPGTDSHENTLGAPATDHDRIDNHPRMTYFMSNWVWATDKTPAALKASLKARRSWIVFEGLGIPSGFGYSATDGTTTVLTGESLTRPSSGAVTLQIQIPTAAGLPETLNGEPQPIISADLIRLDSNSSTGKATVATFTQSGTYSATQSGFYFVYVKNQPAHLKKSLKEYGSIADQTYPWIITNAIQIQ